jgi:hypothetical protein
MVVNHSQFMSDFKFLRVWWFLILHFLDKILAKQGLEDIPYSHFCYYPGPTTQKHTRFPNQGRDINKSVNRGYNSD